MSQRLVISILFILCCHSVAIAQCCSNGTFPIVDEQDGHILLIVEGMINDDLSAANQGVCRVNVEFEHEFLGDLEMSLVSPAGQRVNLIGPIGLFPNTLFTTWDVSFVDCASSELAPDMGFNSQWSNDQPWTSFANYTGVYSPFRGCLSDFDSGPVNGPWTLEISDNAEFGMGEVLSFCIEFCDDTGSDCQQCIADGGELRLPEFPDTIYYCESEELLNFDFDPFEGRSPPDESLFGYQYFVFDQAALLETTADPNLTSYSPGIYNICGLSYDLNAQDNLPVSGVNFSDFHDEFVSGSPGYCVDISNCLVVQIADVTDTTLMEVEICEGESYTFDNQSYTEEGSYFILPNSGVCDESILLNIDLVQLDAVIQSASDIFDCLTEQLILDASESIVGDDTDFEWSTEDGGIVGRRDDDMARINSPGTYRLVINQGNCTDTTHIEIGIDRDSPMASTSSARIDCQNRMTQLSTNISSSIDSLLWMGPNGFRSSDQNPMVQDSGLYELTLFGSNNCEAIFTHRVELDTVLPAIDFTIGTLNCNVSEIRPELVGMDIGYQYQWTGPNGFMSSDMAPNLSLPGTYNVIISNRNNNCSISSTISLAEDRNPPNLTLDAEQITCTNSSTVIQLSSDIPISEVTWTGPDNFQTQDIVPTISEGGMYYISATGTNGCVTIDSIFVTKDDAIPDVEAVGGVLDCDVRSIFLDAVSSINSLTYQWTGPNDFSSMDQMPEISSSGTYTVVVTAENGCTAQDEVTISQANGNFDISFEYDSLTCEVQNIIIEVQGPDTLEYVWTGPAGFSSMQKQPQISAPGDYSLNVIDRYNDCSSWYQITVRQDIALPQVDFQAGLLSCNINEVTIATTPQAEYQYQWTGPNQFQSNLQNPEVTEVGRYDLTLIGNNGCQLDTFFTVTGDFEKAEIFANNITVNQCQEDIELSVNVSNTDANLFWTGPNDFNEGGNPVFATDQGEYIIISELANGCRDTASLELTINAPFPILQIEENLPISCTNPTGDIRVVDDIDYSYQWEGPSEQSFTGNEIMVDEAGMYKLTITNSHQCRVIDSIEMISLVDYPDLQIRADTMFCGSDFPEVQVSSSFSDISYQWTGPDQFSSTSDQFEAQSAGEYTVIATASNRCQSFDTIQVVFDTIAITIEQVLPDTLDCVISVVQLSHITNDEGLEFSWTGPNGFRSQEASPSTSQDGTYELLVTAPNRCTSTLIYDVELDTLRPEVELFPDSLTCGHAKVQIRVESDPDLQYSWNGPQGFASQDSTPIVVFGGLYELIATARNGCTVRDQVFITEARDTPFVEIMPTSLDCDLAPVPIVSQSEHTIVSYQWFGPNGFFSQESMPLIDQLGVYSLIALGENGCVFNDSIEVVMMPNLPVIDLVTSSITCRDPVVDIFFNNDENSIESASWFGPNNFVQIGDTVQISESGTYKLIVIGENTCVDSTHFEILVDTLSPSSEITQMGELICNSNTIQLQANSTPENVQYQWTSSDFLPIGDLSMITISEPGWYYLMTMMEQNGCMTLDSILVERTGIEELVFDFTTTSPECFGEHNGSIDVLNVFLGDEPFQFFLDDIPSSSGFFENLSGGEYQLTVIDNNGCEGDTTITLTDGAELTLDLGDDLLLLLGMDTVIVSEINSFGRRVEEYNWTYGHLEIDADGEEVLIRPIYADSLRLQIITEDGCRAEDAIFVDFEDASLFYAPNVFSLSDQAPNSTYQIFPGPAIEQVFSFEILDRWGNLLHRTDDSTITNLQLTWDGKKDGQPVQPGVYIYVLELELLNGHRRKFVGNFTLIH